MVAEPLGSDSGEFDFWVNHLDQGQASADSAQPSALDRTWVRLVQKILNLRHLQRVFANVGQYLRNYPRTLLDRTSRTFPNQHEWARKSKWKPMWGHRGRSRTSLCAVAAAVAARASADCQRDKRRSTEAGRRTPEIFNSTMDG